MTILCVSLAAVAGVVSACGGNDADEMSSRPEPPPAVKDAPEPHPRFFFYFDDEDAARRAASVLQEKDYAVRTTPPGEGIAEWSVIAEGTPDALDIVTAEDSMEPWAESLGGEYDGNEIPVGG